MSVYPFRFDCEVRDRSANVLATAKCDVWDNSQSADSAGEMYNSAGVVTAPARDALVGHRNRLLVVDGGDTYRVDTAIWHDILAYIEVTLIRVKPDG